MLTVAYVYKFKHQSVFFVALNQYLLWNYWLIFLNFVICVLCWNLSYAVMNRIWFMIIFEHIYLFLFSEDVKCRYGQSQTVVFSSYTIVVFIASLSDGACCIVLFIFYHSFLPSRVHYLITLHVDWEEEREICVISSNLIYTAIKQVLYGKNHTCFVQI